MKQKLVLMFGEDGVRLFGNRAAMAALAKDLLRISKSPAKDYQEANVVLDALAADRDTTILFDSATYPLMKSALENKTLDVRFMTIEERDFARYKAQVKRRRRVKASWFSED
jgi:hypothetical protein